MTRVCILALCGLPGVGKTTFSKILTKKLFAFDWSFLSTEKVEIEQINYDDLFALQNNGDIFNPEVWKESRSTAITRVQQILNHPKESLRFIIIDDNLYYSSMRHEYFQLARNCK